jgi:TPR repeat protein
MGAGGDKPDDKKALEYFQLAANQGVSEAQCELAGTSSVLVYSFPILSDFASSIIVDNE